MGRASSSKLGYEKHGEGKIAPRGRECRKKEHCNRDVLKSGRIDKTCTKIKLGHYERSEEAAPIPESEERMLLCHSEAQGLATGKEAKKPYAEEPLGIRNEKESHGPPFVDGNVSRHRGANSEKGEGKDEQAIDACRDVIDFFGPWFTNPNQEEPTKTQCTDENQKEASIPAVEGGQTMPDQRHQLEDPDQGNDSGPDRMHSKRSRASDVSVDVRRRLKQRVGIPGRKLTR